MQSHCALQGSTTSNLAFCNARCVRSKTFSFPLVVGYTSMCPRFPLHVSPDAYSSSCACIAANQSFLVVRNGKIDIRAQAECQCRRSGLTTSIQIQEVSHAASPLESKS